MSDDHPRVSLPALTVGATRSVTPRRSLDAIELPDEFAIGPALSTYPTRSSAQPAGWAAAGARSNSWCVYEPVYVPQFWPRRIVVIRCVATLDARGVSASEIV